jgi:hypothetical protein
VERRVNYRIKELYLIDLLNPQILLVKTFDVNNKGVKTFIKPSIVNPKDNIKNINKYITISIEARNKTERLKEIDDFTNFTPIVISGYIPLESKAFYTDLVPTNKNVFQVKMISFFSNIFRYKYHKYIIYAHNFSGFDIIFMYKALLKLAEIQDIKVVPLYRDNKIITIKCRFGRYLNSKKFRYYIEFQDSFLKFPQSLETLSKSFIEDQNFHKMDKTQMINYLLTQYVRIRESRVAVKSYIIDYCIQDCKCLAEVLFKFGIYIHKNFNLNIHDYATLSSLVLNIYLTKYITTPLEKKSKILLPKVYGGIYKESDE